MRSTCADGSTGDAAAPDASAIAADRGTGRSSEVSSRSAGDAHPADAALALREV